MMTIMEMFEIFKLAYILKILRILFTTFCTLQRNVATVRWASLRLSAVKFLPDVVHQKILKSVDFSQSFKK